MRAAVLSRGPSLLRTWPKRTKDYDRTYGVNHAEFDPDVLVALDKRVWGPMDKRDRPLVNRKTELYRNPPFFRAQCRSVFLAIYAAVADGATEVDVYGAEMDGEEYAGGYAQGGGPSQRRWENERKWFAEVVRDCRRRGVKVRRVK